MKQEDKDLLLRYLSMALPWGVVLHFDDKVGQEDEPLYGFRENGGKFQINDAYFVEEVKPYLRSMSSMTKEEDKQRIQLGIWRSSQTNGHEVTGIKPDISQSYNSQAFQRAFNFLLKNHFDIFGLVPRGLAVEVTKENNPYNIMEG